MEECQCDKKEIGTEKVARPRRLLDTSFMERKNNGKETKV
jgi:hypothetical protein